ncbi:MAG: hypothetical protein RH949_18455 [Coleofasciculus sp. A1-SPW-01]|uniref:hypothetical protein n=1 Tax=Coleofasciculus sp. A1-SPW-01 TaxID=3070819 RepID=UPI0032F3450D
MLPFAPFSLLTVITSANAGNGQLATFSPPLIPPKQLTGYRLEHQSTFPDSTPNNQEYIMTYKNKLYPWCIVRHLPNSQRRVVCRLRSRSDAEGHLQVLRRFMPTLNFTILFDIPPENDDPFTYSKIKI